MARKSNAAGFPGNAEINTFGQRYVQLLQRHGITWNDAWDKMLAGDFEFKQWLSTVVQTVDANARFVIDVYKGSPDPDPKWARFRPWTKSKEPPEPITCSAGISLDSPDLTKTSFARFGVEPTEDELPTLTTRVVNAPQGKIELAVAKGIKHPKSGLYIAFVFGKGRIEVPLLIVLLEVVDK